MLRQNPGYKILALLLALFMWFYVTISQRNAVDTQSFTVPVEIRNLAKGYVAAVTPVRVRVLLRGRQAALESPVPAPEAFVDARRARPGVRTVKVAHIVPTDLVLVRAEPTRVRLKVDPIIAKTVRVEANVVGKAPPGYVFGDSLIVPASVTVSGVREAVAQVKHVVVNVDASATDPNSPQTNVLRAVDDAGEMVDGVEISRPQARVTLPVKQVLSYQTVPVALRSEGEPAPGYRVTAAAVNPPTVTIAGDAERLRRVTSIATGVVRIDGATGDIRRLVPLALPDGVTTVSDAKTQVVINIKRQG